MNVSTILSNASIADTLGFILSDAADTYRNTAQVLDFLSDLGSFLYEGEVATSDNFQSQILDKLPVMVNYELEENVTRQVFIDAIGSAEPGIGLFATSTEAPILARICSYTYSSGTVIFENVLAPDEDVEGFSFNDVCDTVSVSNAMSGLLSDITDTLLSTTGNYLVNFQARTQSYVDALPGSVKMIYDQVMSAFSVGGDNRIAVTNVLVDIYKDLSKLDATDADLDGELMFNDAEFYVKGFYGEALINAGLMLASAIGTAIMMWVNPILGVVVAGISGIVQAFIPYLSQQSYASVNCNSLNRLLEVPIHQLKTAISTILEYDEDLSWREYNPYRSIRLVLDYVRDHGCATIQTPGMRYVLWVDDEYLYCESYVSADMYWAYPDITDFSQLFTYVPAVHGTHNIGITTLTNNQRFSAYSADDLKHGMDSSLIQKILYGTIDDHADYKIRQMVCNSLLVYLASYAHRSTWYTSYEDIDDIKEHATDHMSFADVMALLYNYVVDPTHSSAMPSWSMIVNNIIPSIRQFSIASGDPGASVDVLLDVAYQWDRLYYSTLTAAMYMDPTYLVRNMANKTAGRPDLNNLCIAVPEYNGTALATSIMVAATISMAVVAAGVFALRIRRHIQTRLLKRLTAAEAAKYRWEANPTAANWDAYVGAIRSYNWRARLFGASRVSYLTGDLMNSNRVLQNVLDKPTASDIQYLIRPW